MDFRRHYEPARRLANEQHNQLELGGIWANHKAGNPSIDLFTAADADGGTGYLTNSTSACNQRRLTQSPYVGQIGPGQSLRIYYLLAEPVAKPFYLVRVSMAAER